MTPTLKFRPRARLILQLGDQLIKNESIALLELVKNSYDADASTVTITMKSLDSSKDGLISVEDDGNGMDLDIIRNVWLEPGSDFKTHISNNVVSSSRRRPLGEKGIGRFSAHKLGEVIEVTTRMKAKPEIYVKIDWSGFSHARYIDDVPIEIISRDPVHFKGRSTGTLIKISALRPHQWNDKTLRETYRSINAMSSPFDAPESFKVTLKSDQASLFKGIPTFKEVKNMALYRFLIEMESDEITRFEYFFTPFASMKKLNNRSLIYKKDAPQNSFPDFDKVRNMRGEAIKNTITGKKEKPVIDLSRSDQKIGKVKFEGLIFDRQTKVIKLENIDTKAFKQYLDANGGIRIYRDGVRVYDYGEPENDWLGLEKSRLYEPGVHINKGLILAAVHLDRATSADLIEKTNREGFIDNEAYRSFREAIKYTLKIVEGCRNHDKENVRTYYGLSPKSEPVLAEIAELRDVIESKIVDTSLQKECLAFLTRIEKEYEEINEILLVSAEAGLNLSVAIHEIEKITLELKAIILQETSSKRILDMVERLAEIIQMYGVLIRKGRKKTENLKELIADALFHVEYRLKAHQIEVIDWFSTFRGFSEIKCSSRLVIGSIVNLIDNSIYWLDRAEVGRKKIVISLGSRSGGFLELLVADNGKGFALPPDQLIKPFVSLKPGGIGLGLHIANEVTLGQGGAMEFPKPSDKELPREFAHGAVVSLIFKKDDEK